MFNIGPEELLLILIIGLIVFGPSRLPEMARKVGQGLREFRRVSEDMRGQVRGMMDEVVDLDDTSSPASANGDRHLPDLGGEPVSTPAPPGLESPAPDPAAEAGAGGGSPRGEIAPSGHGEETETPAGGDGPAARPLPPRVDPDTAEQAG